MLNTTFQIITPVLVDDVWCAYLFDRTAKHTTVVDPHPNNERYNTHLHFHSVLINALYDCFQSFFKGCVTPKLDQWEMHYPKLTDFQCERQAWIQTRLSVSQAMFGMHCQYVCNCTNSDTFYVRSHESALCMLHLSRSCHVSKMLPFLKKVIRFSNTIFLFYWY